MNFEIVDNLEDNRLRGWNDLLNKTKKPFPFQKIEWVKSWWKIFSTNKDSLFIILASQDKELTGIAPLMYRKGRNYTVIKFIGTGNFDYFDFVIKKGREAESVRGFLETINNNFEGFELELKNIFADLDTFQSLTRNPFLDSLTFFEDIVPYIELPGTKEKFYYQIKGALRWDVTRRQRRLAQLGKVEFKSCDNIGEVQNLLEDFFSLHIKKWESTGGYSIFKFEKMRQFMRTILEQFFPDKTMNLYYLLLNQQKKIAICPGFEFNNRFIFYTHAYDPDFAKCSPGKILISRLINHSIDKKYHEFDFGIGKEPYKLEWPCRITKLYNIYTFKEKFSLLKGYLKLRRYLICGNYLYILPLLRKARPLVYSWRWLNRRRARYVRFQ